MTGLWLYRRRPCGTVRYRHGGFNASFPMTGHTVGQQLALMEQAAARRRAEAARKHLSERGGETRGKVLSFLDRGKRSSIVRRDCVNDYAGQ